MSFYNTNPMAFSELFSLFSLKGQDLVPTMIQRLIFLIFKYLQKNIRLSDAYLFHHKHKIKSTVLTLRLLGDGHPSANRFNGSGTSVPTMATFCCQIFSQIQWNCSLAKAFAVPYRWNHQSSAERLR